MRAAGYVAVALLIPAWLGAQQVPAQLTLEDALAIARERNPDYQQAVNTARAQDAQIRSAWGAFLPTLNAQLQFSGSNTRTSSFTTDTGTAGQIPETTIRASRASQSLSANFTLFDGLRNFSTLRAARATASASDAGRAFAATRVDGETTRRFYDALRTRRLIALEERLLGSAREQLTNTQQLFRVAGATPEDVLGAEADVATQELQLETARGESEKAKLAVREYLGIPEEIVFAVTGELPEAWDASALNIDALVATATQSNPQVLQLDAAAHAASLRASAARGGRWPTISLSASLSRTVNSNGYDALFDLNPQDRGLGFAVTVNYPLFTGFQTSAQIASASLDADNAYEQLRAGALQVERNVRSAHVDVRNAHRGLELAQRAADLSSERLRLSRERYAIGAIDFATLQLLIDRAAQEERRLISARFQLAQAVVTLEERVGQPVRR